MNKILLLFVTAYLSADMSFSIDESLYKDVEKKADKNFEKVIEGQRNAVKRTLKKLIGDGRYSGAAVQPPVTHSSKSKNPTSNTYKCTYMCFTFGGTTGFGHENMHEYTVIISAPSESEANNAGLSYAKNSCQNMGYSGVHSRWWKGSIHCERQ